MPGFIPHDPNCPCVRCNQRRKVAKPEFETFVTKRSKAPREYDGTSDAPTKYTPQGPSGPEAIAWAADRRRARRAEEAERERTGR